MGHSPHPLEHAHKVNSGAGPTQAATRHLATVGLREGASMLGPITWHVEREGPCVDAQLGLVLPSLHTNWREFLGSVRELAPNSVVVRRATTPSCGELCHVHRRNLNGNATEAVVSLNSM